LTYSNGEGILTDFLSFCYICSVEYYSVNKRLQDSFCRNWELEALSNYQGETIRYSQLAKRIKLMHLAFEHCGLQKGDRVAICGRNQVNWAVSFLGALTYGAVPVPLLHEFKSESIHNLVVHSGSRVLFVDEQIWENLSENEMPCLSVIVSLNDFNTLYSTYAEFCSAKRAVKEELDSRYPQGFGPEDIEYFVEESEDLALINYTSGTSGFSKGVMIPFRALECNIKAAGETAEPQMNSSSQTVSMLPMAHMFGLMFEFLFEMTIGAHVHFLTRIPSPKVILKAFEDIKPDIIIAVPLIIEKVYKTQIKPVADRSKAFLSIPILGSTIQKKICDGLVSAFGGKFEEVILGGAPFNPEAAEFLRKIHFPFTVGYGMTECAPLITYAKWNKNKKGSCGQPVPGCHIRIDSRDPKKVPGEIQIKGDNVFLGYYNNRKATKDAFTSDNWFKTGDMGVMDSDGFLYLRGRSKCMILGPSGQNIYPEELEAVLNNASYVVDSLVVEDSGGLTALIYADVRQAVVDGLSVEAMQERIRLNLPEINKQLPSYAQIRKIEFMAEDFERTPKKSIKRYLYQRN